MRLDLASSQWDAVSHGELHAPSGARYSRRSTKAKRRAVDELIAAGAPLVVHYWAGGQLDWLDGDDAVRMWQDVRGAVVHEPRLRGNVEWTAGVWENEEGQPIVLLTGHC